MQVLYAPELPKPENATVLLSQVVINGLDKLNTSAGNSMGEGGSLWEEDDSAPFIVVFQYGRSVWAGFPVTRVSRMLCLGAWGLKSHGCHCLPCASLMQSLQAKSQACG